MPDLQGQRADQRITEARAVISVNLLAILATWALVVVPLLLVLGALVIFVWRPRREERRRREAQLTSVFNAKARRERGD